MSRTSKHSGAIKALQFNAFRSELLATVGAKGELFISDLNNVGSPFRMGNAVARADDFDCLDWNKRTAHILATGSSGGTMTVWDVKNKRESLTLNNLGRKPTTRLMTAIPSDTDPVILIWDLRNANAPEKLYSGSETESDRRITRGLLLGEFEKALDVCLQEDRMSDAFMIAICGGQHCIEKAQKAYFDRKATGPNYLRLLASVVGKNLWDLVHNADLDSWKEIMATLCTYADAKEFPELCEALGDRLEEQTKAEESDNSLLKDASFCYLAGSKLEKVVSIWIAELEEREGAGLQNESKGSSFAIHARSLQSFIEKVTIFREVIHYKDSDRNAKSDWKLAPLYDKYTEYADIASSHGQLHIAERYLDLLPINYPAAEPAQSRVKQATRKAVPQAVPKQPTNTSLTPQSIPQPDFQQQRQNSVRPPPAPAQSNPYTPALASTPPNQNPYAPTNGQSYGPRQGGHQGQFPQQPRQQAGVLPPPSFGASYPNPSLGAPPRNLNTSPSVPAPSKALNMSNWNDTPEDFFKPPTSRRGTPGIGANVPSAYQPTQVPTPGSSLGLPPKSTPPIGPPPKGPAAPPPRVSSPSMSASYQQPERPQSAVNQYAPQPPSSTLPVQQQGPIPRGPSPYDTPPSAPPPSNRYAPAQPAQSAAQQDQMIPRTGRQAPTTSNPYAPQHSYNQPQQNSAQQPPHSAGPPPQASGPPSASPPRPSQGSRPGTAQSQRKAAPKFPSGDRSHISASARPVYEILNQDMQRVKSRAPASFKAQVNDTEKRLNILFDHLNNEDLLKNDTVGSMVELSQAIQAKDFEQAQAIHVEIMTNKTDECGNWMVGVKRLIAMSRATP
ncbi:protein transport protein SEC31, partial [Lecanoromycetidae sp. Uapishka_2]